MHYPVKSHDANPCQPAHEPMMIVKALCWLRVLFTHPGIFPVFLLLICAAAYSPLIPRLGFYWDDFPIAWIAATMGNAGLARYFSTNRPVWGLLYQITTPILGNSPLTWQIFGLLMRWVTGVALWALLRLVWRRREQFAAWSALLFVLYPGFTQQFIAFLYSHFYIVLASFLFSLALMIAAIRQPRMTWPLSIASMFLSLVNLFSMEYFILLDLLRPILIWVVLSESMPDRGKRLKKTLQLWLPYLVLWGGAMVWRSLLFGYNTYQPVFINQLKSQPLQALRSLIPVVVQDIWKTAVTAWSKAFVLPDPALIDRAYQTRFWLLIAAAGVLTAVFFWVYQPSQSDQKKRWAFQPLFLGILALCIAGGPFWLTDLKISLKFSYDRFTLPFMLGASLLWAALLAWLPLPGRLKPLIVAVITGFAVGQQFLYAIDYNRDWSVQRSLFWQLSWRAPGLRPGTLLLANELPVIHYTDNSLSAPLNWMYDPDNDSQIMKYMLLYPTLRKEEAFGNFQPNAPLERDYLAATFFGNTNQMVTIYYEPPGCLRVLDPEVEGDNWMVPDYLRATLALSNLAVILPTPQQGQAPPRPPAAVYGAEIARGWCYYYEKADLARQAKDWPAVAALGNQAFAAGDYPNDPIERFPFIEGYAHAGEWAKALALSRDAVKITPLTRPMLCALWQRIQRETPHTAEQSDAIQAMRGELECK